MKIVKVKVVKLTKKQLQKPAFVKINTLYV
jgi:hypothetical protein